MGPVFGLATNVLKDNKIVAIRALIESDWTPALVLGIPPMSAAVLSGLRAKKEEYRQKRIDRLEEEAPKFHAALWATISPESRERIKAHTDYQECFLNRDPNLLVQIAKSTHLTHYYGVGAASAGMDKIKWNQRFHELKQKPNQSLAEFLQEFIEVMTILESLGVAKPSEPDQAMMFINRLDPTRFGPVMVFLANNAALNIAYPQTL
jgi:hypothetical protein